MIYVKFPLPVRNVEDLLHERGIDLCHETVRFWWNRFGPMFASWIKAKRVGHVRAYTHWRWRLDEAYVKINGQLRYLWRAVDHEGQVLESLPHQDQVQGRRAEVHQEGDEAPRPSRGDHHRRPALLQGGDQEDRQRRGCCQSKHTAYALSHHIRWFSTI